MVVNRRCWNFDQDTGEPCPPHYGCPNPSCPFAHPDSPRWKDAARTRRERLPAPSSSTHDVGSFSMKKDRGWPGHNRDGPSSLERRSDSGTKDTSSNWSSSGSTWGQPSGGWGDKSTSSTNDSGWGEPSSSNVTWGQPSQLPKKPPPPSSPPHKENPRHERPLQPPPPPPPLPSSSRRSSLNVSTSMQLSETSSHHTLPPVEAREGQVRRESSSRKGKEPVVASPAAFRSRDAQKFYSNRISLLSEAAMIRNEYVQVIRALEARRKLQSTHKFHHISENVQSKLHSFAQEYEDKGQELKAKLEEMISRLVEAELWPAGLPDKEVPATDEAVLNQIRKAEDRLDRLEKMIKEREAAVGRAQVLPLEEGEVQPSIGMKRRRESTPDGQTEGPSARVLLNRVEQLEARTADIDNQAIQQVNNIHEIVDARVEEKLERLHIGHRIPEDAEMHDIAVTTQSQSGGSDIQQQVTKLTNDLEGFAGDTAELITKHTQMDIEFKKVKAENAALKNQIAEFDASQRTLKADVDRNQRQLEAVLRAVDIIREARPTHLPLDAQAFEPMRRQILEAVLKDLKPALTTLREHCDAVVTSAREDTLRQVGAKLGRTVELVNIIYGYLGRSWQGKEYAPP